MNKTELIQTVAENTRQTQNAVAITLDAVIDAVVASLAQGDSVKLQNFGVFQVKHRAAYQGRNPRTGEKATIPACYVPSFRASKHLKETINE